MRHAVLSFALLVAAMPAVAQVTPIEDVVRSQPVTVAGSVERFHDEDEITLRDATGTLRVYLGPKPVALEMGEQIEIRGFMDDNLIMKELYAREIVRADGTVVTVDRDYE